MLLVDQLVSFSAETAECRFRISHENAFYVHGRGVPAYVGIEYMAQCIAVHAGARAHLSGHPPPIGFLLGTRNMELFDDYLVESRDYIATCHQLIRNEDGMGSFECKLMNDGRVIAKARLAVMERHYEQASVGL